MSNSQQETENQVKYAIYDFECSPDELTMQLGLEPTETYIKGETRLVGKIKHKVINKENAWVLKSTLSVNSSVEEHILHLLKIIEPYEERFLKIANKYYTEFSCGIHFYEVNPGIQFDEKIIKKIARLNARIDLDMYCMSNYEK